MLYGNSSMGFGYSPNRSRDVSHDNLRSSFIGAQGNRAIGYYGKTGGNSTGGSNKGWYDGAGRYHRGNE